MGKGKTDEAPVMRTEGIVGRVAWLVGYLLCVARLTSILLILTKARHSSGSTPSYTSLPISNSYPTMRA